MIVLLVTLLYAVLVVGGIRFFQQVHTWDKEASRMFEEEQGQWESRATPRRRERSKKASVRVAQPLTENRIARVLSAAVGTKT